MTMCILTHYRLLDADAYLEGVLSIELTDVAAENIWAPDDGEVLRRHPRSVGVQRHLVQVAHQEVDRPEIMEGSTFNLQGWPQGVAHVTCSGRRGVCGESL